MAPLPNVLAPRVSRLLAALVALAGLTVASRSSLAAAPGRGVLLSSTGERALVLHKNQVLVLQLPSRFGPATRDGAKVVQRLPAPDLAAEPALSADGNHVALLFQRSTSGPLELELRRVGQPRATAVKLSELTSGQPTHVAISDEGRHVAVTQKGRVYLVEVGAPRARLIYDHAGTYAVSSELCGRGAGLRLAVRVAEPSLLEAQSTFIDLREVRGRTPRRWKSAKGTAGRWPAVSPQGDLIGQPTALGVLVHAPARSDQLLERGRLADPQAAGVRFSTDGRTAVTYGRPAGGGRPLLRHAVADGAARGKSTLARVDRSWQALRDDGVLLVLQARTAPPVSGPQGLGCQPTPGRGHCAVVLHEDDLLVELLALTFD